MAKAKLPDTFNWRETYGYLSFLGQFKKPCQLSEVYHPVGLDESVKAAFKRLKKQGAIQPCSLEEKLAYLYTFAELKSLLQGRGEKTSGKKEELIARLIQVDRPGMEASTRELELFKCSPLGLQALEEHKDGRGKALEEAQSGVYQAVYRGDFSPARQIYEAYIEKYGQPSRYDPFDHDWTKAMIIDLVKYVPEWMVERYGQENMRHIQAGIVMKEIWPEKNVWEWLPDNFPLEDETVRRLVPLLDRYRLYYHEIATNLGADYFDLALEFDDLDDPNLDPEDQVCESCRQLDGIILDHRLMPDWPFDGCQNELGCLPESCHSMSGARTAAREEDPDNELDFDYEDDEPTFDEKVLLYRYTVHPDASKYLQEYREIRAKVDAGQISGEQYLDWLAGYFPGIKRYDSFACGVVADHIPGMCWNDPDNYDEELS